MRSWQGKAFFSCFWRDWLFHVFLLLAHSLVWALLLGFISLVNSWSEHDCSPGLACGRSEEPTNLAFRHLYGFISGKNAGRVIIQSLLLLPHCLVWAFFLGFFHLGNSWSKLDCPLGLASSLGQTEGLEGQTAKEDLLTKASGKSEKCINETFECSNNLKQSVFCNLWN